MNALKAIFSALSSQGHVLISALRFGRFELERESKTSGVWLVQAVDDPAFLLRFYFYLLSSRDLGEHPRVIWINTRLLFKSGKSARARFLDFFTQGPIYLWIWKLLYLKILKAHWIQYRPLEISIQTKIRAQKIYESIRAKEDLERLVIDGLKVGDLIYDTYLRFKPAPTVNLKDPLVVELISVCLELVPRVEQCLREERVTRVVTGYVTYLQHGILARVALRAGIELHSMGAFNQLVVNPTPDFPYQRRRFRSYPEMFKSVRDPEAALAAGKKLIEDRITGKKDELTFYMKQSSFSESGSSEVKAYLKKIIGDRQAILIMGHDFFDSPHIYGEMLYPDFLEWVNACMSLASKSPYKILFKPHPNSVTDESVILKDLSERYPEVEILPSTISNRQLMQLHPAFLLTVYGTVAYEFASQGLKVLCCGENPHQCYGFSKLITDRYELEQIILGQKSPDFDINLSEIHEYVYLHSYRIQKGELELYPWELDFKSLPHFLAEQRKRVEVMKEALLNINQI